MAALVCLLVVTAGCDFGEEAQTPSNATPTTVAANAPTSVVTPDPGTPTTLETPTSIRVVSSPAAAASPTSAAAITQAPTAYVVQPGDTLGGIALQFDTTVDDLMQANNITSPDLIFIGQTLKIARPAASGAATAQSTSVATVGDPASTGTPDATEPRTPTAISEPTSAAEQVPTTTSIVPQPPETLPTPVVVNGHTYDAYNYAVIKKGQWYHYTCEFDAAWVVLKTYGYDVGLDEQVSLVGLDTSIEPYYKETANGIVIYGGDITTVYSGDYKTNFLARSSGQAMTKVFEHFGLKVTPVSDRPSLEAALLRGELVWIKTTVDFKPWKAATWVMPDGRTYKTVLGNDHALVVMGFNESNVLIRDPLGPTSTGRTRKYEYEVPWSKFMASWGAQSFDGLAVAPPER